MNKPQIGLTFEIAIVFFLFLKWLFAFHRYRWQVESRGIERLELYRRRPLYLHAYVTPYILLYILVSSLYWRYWRLWEDKESQLAVCILAYGSVASLQILTWLSCQWSIAIEVFCKFSKVKEIEDAAIVWVVPRLQRGYDELCPLYSDTNLDRHFWFFYQKRKYTYRGGDKRIFAKADFPIHRTFSFYRSSRGFSTKEQADRARQIYGDNVLDIPIPTFGELFKEHAVAPFFVFQVFCIGLWCLDEYWYYSVFTLFMLVTFESTVVFQRLRSLKEIRGMATKPYSIHVYRCGTWVSILSNELIPGDIVSLVKSKDERSAPCDILLLYGSCIVNEAMLTGESTPQLKVRGLSMGL
jgi:manganese-transporting P-type ATPase